MALRIKWLFVATVLTPLLLVCQIVAQSPAAREDVSAVVKLLDSIDVTVDTYALGMVRFKVEANADGCALHIIDRSKSSLQTGFANIDDYGIDLSNASDSTPTVVNYRREVFKLTIVSSKPGVIRSPHGSAGSGDKEISLLLASENHASRLAAALTTAIASCSVRPQDGIAPSADAPTAEPTDLSPASGAGDLKQSLVQLRMLLMRRRVLSIPRMARGYSGASEVEFENCTGSFSILGELGNDHGEEDSAENLIKVDLDLSKLDPNSVRVVGATSLIPVPHLDLHTLAGQPIRIRETWRQKECVYDKQGQCGATKHWTNWQECNVEGCQTGMKELLQIPVEDLDDGRSLQRLVVRSILLCRSANSRAANPNSPN